jgi:hypothetical protein
MTKIFSSIIIKNIYFDRNYIIQTDIVKSMEKLNINDYGKGLYSLINTAIGLKCAVVKVGDWKPKPHMCHHNVTKWCSMKEGFEPVRGWLYFDIPSLKCVKFIAHSVVKTLNGEFFDITPVNASQGYPFILSGLTDSEFEKIVGYSDNGEIIYYTQEE